ncbi:MAG: ABC transporter substrate-binding protein [Sphaerochaetaceae bacterium]
MKKFTVLLTIFLVLALPIFAGGEKESGDSVKTVHYYSMWNEAEPQGMVLAEAAEAFEEQSGIHVEINFNGRNIRKTLEPAIQAGETIDIFDEDIERVSFTWGQFIQPLDDLAAKVYPTTNGKPYESQINSTLVKLARSFTEDGSLSVIPYQPFMFAFMYNKALFAKAGITEVPKTQEEFEEVCRKLMAVGITPVTVDDGYMCDFFGYNIDRMIGSEKTIEMANNNDFSDSSVLKFGQIWEEFSKKGYMSAKAASNIYPACQVQEMAPEKVAMNLNGTWLPNEVSTSNPNIEWGTFAYPSISPEGDGIEANNIGSQSFAINKDSKCREEAFQFIVFVTTGEYDQKLADDSNGAPMDINNTWPKVLSEAEAAFNSTTTRLPWAVGMENLAEVNAKIKENFSKLIAGSINAQEFYENMNK